MDRVKLIAIDIGGTLINDDNTISKENVEVIKKAKEKGIQIALITARMYSSTKYISNVISADYGVFGNGSFLMNLSNFDVYYSENISSDLVKKLICFGKEMQCYIHLSGLLYEVSDQNDFFALKHNILNENYSENLKSNIKIVDDLIEYANKSKDIVKVIFVSEENMDDFKLKLEKRFSDVYVCEYNKNLYESAIAKTINYIEVGIRKTTKADGLQKLVKSLDIDINDVLVIGDGDNDIEMFNIFKKSGCLINGTSEAKQSASYVSRLDNNNSGVAEIIKHFTEIR